MTQSVRVWHSHAERVNEVDGHYVIFGNEISQSLEFLAAIVVNAHSVILELL